MPKLAWLKAWRREIAATTIIYMDASLITGESHRDVQRASDATDALAEGVHLTWGPAFSHAALIRAFTSEAC